MFYRAQCHRGHRLMLTAAAFAAGLAGFAVPALADTASGVVFEDTNGNGTREADEAGLGGISISNGRQVIQTNADGSYRIGLDDGEVLFVIQPATHRAPVNADQIPQFYYVHKPDGTPAGLRLRYRGIDPTGPLPESIDFPLQPIAKKDRFKAILFADPQPQTNAEVDYIRDKIMAGLIGTDADFGITAGDIMFDDMSYFPRYNRIVSMAGIPWYNVPGNHELNFQAPDDKTSLETYTHFFGPDTYSFDYGELHFILMDDVFYHGTNTERGEDGRVRKMARPDPRGRGVYEARITDRQLGWLAEDLALVPTDKLVVLVMHIPLRAITDPTLPNINVQNLEALFKVLGRRGHRVLSLAGHMHTNYHVTFNKGDAGWPGDTPLHHQTLATVSGAWWSGPRDVQGNPVSLQSDGVPNGYHILHADGSDAWVEFVAADESQHPQMRITLDTEFHQHSPGSTRDFRQGQLKNGPIRADAVYSTNVLVNFYNGAPGSRVTLQVDDGPAQPMFNLPAPSPTALEIISRHKETYKDWVEAYPTNHIWAAPLPKTLGSGTYRLTVTGTDAYGKTHTAHKILEVQGPARR